MPPVVARGRCRCREHLGDPVADLRSRGSGPCRPASSSSSGTEPVVPAPGQSAPPRHDQIGEARKFFRELDATQMPASQPEAPGEGVRSCRLPSSRCMARGGRSVRLPLPRPRGRGRGFALGLSGDRLGIPNAARIRRRLGLVIPTIGGRAGPLPAPGRPGPPCGACGRGPAVGLEELSGAVLVTACQGNIDPPMLYLVWSVARVLARLLVLPGAPGADEATKDLEILVLRHQLRSSPRLTGSCSRRQAARFPGSAGRGCFW